MSCIAVPHLSIGDIPGLSLVLPDITIPLPDLSVDFCCKGSFSPGPIVIPVGAILNPMLAADPTGTTFDSIMLAVNAAVDAINGLLDQLTFECPLN